MTDEDKIFWAKVHASEQKYLRARETFQRIVCTEAAKELDARRHRFTDDHIAVCEQCAWEVKLAHRE